MRFASSGCILALALAACSAASAPESVVDTSGASAADLARLPRTSVFCHPGATTIPLSQLGLGPGELPAQVALTRDAVWVLFEPARLVRITRSSGQVRATSRTGAPGEEWMVMDADPTDGSLWLVARDFGLVHFGDDFAPRGRIRLSREVVGKGVLAALLVGEETLYAVPSCGEYGVWHLDREGKVLGTDFRAPQPDGPIDPDTMNCSSLSAMRDPEGRVVAWDPAEAKAFRAEPGGAWAEIPPDPYRQITSCGAETVDDPNAEGASRVFLRACNRLIFWQGRPLFLGLGDLGATHTRLAASGPGQQSLETCFGDAIYNVAADADGYAVVTRRAVVFGSFDGAPALP